jgi:hypothetical protein
MLEVSHFDLCVKELVGCLGVVVGGDGVVVERKVVAVSFNSLNRL